MQNPRTDTVCILSAGGFLYNITQYYDYHTILPILHDVANTACPLQVSTVTSTVMHSFDIAVGMSPESCSMSPESCTCLHLHLHCCCSVYPESRQSRNTSEWWGAGQLSVDVRRSSKHRKPLQTFHCLKMQVKISHFPRKGALGQYPVGK